MKAYGDKISAGYMGNKTQKPWCRCCNGSYAKVGRASNKRNNERGLKKSARQVSKDTTEEQLHEYLFDEVSPMADVIEQAEKELAEEMNGIIAEQFTMALKSVVPELSWADSSEDEWWLDSGLETRGLSKLTHKMRTWR